MINVNCLNNIAACGLKLFSDEYNTESSFEDAQAVLVRSAKLHDMELSDNLLAIARAGAGVNNIPLDKCAEEGIVVFNTPGANANAVKEQVIAAMLLASRDLIGGNKWVADNAEDPDIARACGVNTNSAMALSYILGYGFAAAAGIMTGILYNSITPALGEVPSYKMLAIIVLGGLGNPLGTVVAGLIIGFAEVMLSTYTKLPIPKDAIAFVVLIIVLLIKPSGLFGQRNKV